MTLNPVLLPFATANGGATTLSADVSGGVQGGYPGSVSVLLSAALTLIQKQAGDPQIAGFTGAASPMDTAGLVLQSGSTVKFSLPQAKAIVNAGLGTITGYN